MFAFINYICYNYYIEKKERYKTMTKTKKELLTNIILDKCNSLTNDEITKKDIDVLSDFIKKCLHFHGCNGYMFHVSDGYYKEYIAINDDLSIQRIAFFVLDDNNIKNIFNK